MVTKACGPVNWMLSSPFRGSLWLVDSTRMGGGGAQKPGGWRMDGKSRGVGDSAERWRNEGRMKTKASQVCSAQLILA